MRFLTLILLCNIGCAGSIANEWRDHGIEATTIGDQNFSNVADHLLALETRIRSVLRDDYLNDLVGVQADSAIIAALKERLDSLTQEVDAIRAEIARAKEDDLKNSAEIVKALRGAAKAANAFNRDDVNQRLDSLEALLRSKMK